MKKPNIIFILADQWRGDCLGVNGHPVVRTPNLDAMAARGGVSFDRAYSTCPSCIAARASIFTGLTPYSQGRIGYEDGVPWNYDDMLAQMLADDGYQTHCVGKTHFYPQGASCGFQSQNSYEELRAHDAGYVNEYEQWLEKESDGTFREIDNGLDFNSWVARPSVLPEKWHLNYWTVSKSVDFLEGRDKNKPFFLNVSFARPHPPFDPPQAYYDMFQGVELPPVPVGEWSAYTDHPMDSINGPHGVLPPDVLDHTRRAYYAQIAHIDNQIGRLQMHLRRLGIRDTWFVFTSDHGEMLGDHNRFRKMYALEGSARIPFIIKPPGDCERGALHRDQPVAIEDTYSTILDIAGIPVPSKTEGRSLLPFLTGEPEEWRDVVHGEHSGWGTGRQFMTDGRTKYIWKTKTGKEHLFDLVNDPQELQDLSDKPEGQEWLNVWRDRMIAHLEPRCDGMSDGEKLIPLTGEDPAIMPWAETGIFSYNNKKNRMQENHEKLI